MERKYWPAVRGLTMSLILVRFCFYCNALPRRTRPIHRGRTRFTCQKLINPPPLRPGALFHFDNGFAPSFIRIHIIYMCVCVCVCTMQCYNIIYIYVYLLLFRHNIRKQMYTQRYYIERGGRSSSTCFLVLNGAGNRDDGLSCKAVNIHTGRRSGRACSTTREDYHPIRCVTRFTRADKPWRI